MTRTCSTCIHDGCCIGLPHCGGSCWAPAFGPCAECDVFDYCQGNGMHLRDGDGQLMLCHLARLRNVTL